MVKTAIPVIRVRYAEEFLRAIRARGLPCSRLLKRFGLTEAALRYRDNYMAMHQFAAFTAAAATDSDIPQLGLEAGMAPREQHSDFSRAYVYAPTLGASIEAIISAGRSEDSTAAVELVRAEGLSWLRFGPVEYKGEAVRQIELFRYGAMLSLVRSVAGGSWLPPRLSLQHPDDGRLRKLPLIAGVDVTFGERMMAVGIPLALLPASLPQRRKVDRPAGATATEELDFDVALSQIVRTHVLSHSCGVNSVARATGLSVRSLQRRLAECGTTYTRLLERVRIETARDLMRSGMALGDVAGEIGYSHATHFSRAFRRVYGVPPREIRSMQRL